MWSRRITHEIVIRSLRTEGGRRCGCYWIVEVLNHLGMIESSVVFFFLCGGWCQWVRVFPLRGFGIVGCRKFYILSSYFYIFVFTFSYLTWDVLCDPLWMHGLGVVRIEAAAEKGFRCFTFLL